MHPPGLSRRVAPALLTFVPLLLSACGVAEGGAGEACYPNGTCNAGFVCIARLCSADETGEDAAIPVDSGFRGGPDAGPLDGGLDGGPGDATMADAALPDASILDAGADAAVPGFETPLDGPTVRGVEPGAALFDADGTPHVFVGGDALLHFWHAPEGWRSEVVAPHAQLASATLRDGRPVVAFVDHGERVSGGQVHYQAVRVAFPSELGWRVETVTEGARPVYPWMVPEVAASTDGRVYVAYQEVPEASDARVMLATRDSAGTWSTELLASLDRVRVLTHRVQVGVDAAGEPIVSWHQQAGPTVLARRVEAGWSLSELAGFSEGCDMLVSGGEPTFVCRRVTGGEVSVRRPGAPSQLCDTLGATSTPASVSAAMDADGSVWFSFRERSPETGEARVSAGRASGSGCVTHPVVTGERAFFAPYLLDDDDTETFLLPPFGSAHAMARHGSDLLVAYVDFDSGGLFAARSSDGGESFETDALAVDLGPHGMAPTVALDGEGGVWMASVSIWTGRVRLIDPRGAPVALPTSMQVPVIRLESPVALSAGPDEVVLALNDRPGRTRVARHRISTGEWTELEPVAIIPPGLSFVNDAAGLPVLRGDGDGWFSLETGEIQRGGPAGGSLAFAADGTAWVVGFRGSSSGVYAARPGAPGALWIQETVEPSPGLSGRPSAGPIAAAVQGTVVHAAYVDPGSDRGPEDGAFAPELRYARRTSEGWEVEVVEATDVPGGPRRELGVDLAITADGRPVVVFHSYLRGAVRMAVRALDGTWRVEDVAADGDDGWLPRLVLDGDGNAVVAWHHGARGTLETVRRSLP